MGLMMVGEKDYRGRLAGLLQKMGSTNDAKEVLRQLGKEGLIEVCFDQEATSGDQLPLDLDYYRILIEELAKTRNSAVTLSIVIHCGVFLPLIMKHATANMQPIVGQALRGEVLGAIAATEKVGSDFMSMDTTASITNDYIDIHGHKRYVTNGYAADYIIVYARWKEGRLFPNYCAILVPNSYPDIECERVRMGVMEKADIAHLSFRQIRVDRCCLLGKRQLGMYYFLSFVGVERIAGGVWAYTAAEQCLSEAQRDAALRSIGQKTLWERESIKMKLAECVVQVRLLKALVHQEILRSSGNKPDPLDTAVIKASVFPILEKAIGLCLQLQGARGLEKESDLLRLFNDFRVFGVAGGSTETMLEWIAEQWAASVSAEEKV